MSNNVVKKEIFAMATDPIYIGTGGYTIGRVDNTIVRDPITNIPKIPGSSLAGTWRYYVTLDLINDIKDKKPDFKDKDCNNKSLKEKFEQCEWKEKPLKKWHEWKYNKISKITCAGQDNTANEILEKSNTAVDKNGNTGHCGHCIVCKAFGFAKKDISNQGMLFFSDLNILYFPVYTRLGTKWITSPKLLNENFEIEDGKILTTKGDEKYLNLGWLNLEVGGQIEIDLDLNNLDIKKEDIVIVSDNLISQIINSNLEVRTSVSIDPITGAAKEGALFTSEAIPRGTIFYGEIRGFKREDSNLPSIGLVCDALDETKIFYETLGIGGMTTRGFGRLKIKNNLKLGDKNEKS